MTRKTADAARETLKPKGPMRAGATKGAAAKDAVSPRGAVPQSPSDLTATVCAALAPLKRQHNIVIRSRIIQFNRLQAIIATDLGYRSGLSEKERKALFGVARGVIAAAEAGQALSGREGETIGRMGTIVRASMLSINALMALEAGLVRRLKTEAARLPVASWIEAPERKGLGLLSLAQVIGETGDLRLYANPAKVWRRMGCAPREFEGKTLMGSTWRSGREGSLPASEWEAFGYSPRRRSLAYVVGQNLLKLNFLRGGEGSSDTESAAAATEEGDLDEATVGAGDATSATDGGSAGPYRLRYLEARARAEVTHPDWPKLRSHRHGMLLAVKRLLRDLWCAWNTPRG